MMSHCSIALATVFILSWPTSATSNCGRLQSCHRGHCRDNSTCICDPGWVGTLCNQCGGRIRLTETTGFIVDSPLDYDIWKTCTWIIDTEGSNASIVLRVHEFATECNWDYLYVFDGSSVEAPLLAAFSGVWKQSSLFLPTDISPTSTASYNTTNSSVTVTPSVPDISNSSTTTSTPTLRPSMNGTGNLMPTVTPTSSVRDFEGFGGLELVARSGVVLLYFFSDAAYSAEGFNISYHITDCLGNCSGHGVCDISTSLCECNAGWSGSDCSLFVSPCDANCSFHGFCNNVTQTCICGDGFTGVDCGVRIAHAHWEAIVPVVDVAGRASHSSVVYNESMFIFGGYGFAKEGFDNFVRFNFLSTNWSLVETNSTIPEPISRYGHSAVLYKDAMFVYGGSINNRPTNEFWSFNFTSGQWNFIFPVQVENITEPLLNVTHHTATVVNSSMLVIFGLSHKYGFISTVQEYDFEMNRWRHVETSGVAVNGAVGHASVYVEAMGLVFVYGGFGVRPGVQSPRASGDLLAYDPTRKQWSMLEGSRRPRFFHSIVLMGSQLIVFGGNTHADLTRSTGSLCFSDDVISYDIVCDEWRDMPRAGLPDSISRYGHSAVVHNDSMYLMGGFNGTMHSTIWQYHQAMCESLTRGDCNSSRIVGRGCIWVSDASKCVPADQVDLRVYKETTCPHKAEQLDCRVHVECAACIGSGCDWCSSTALCVPHNTTSLCPKRNTVDNATECKILCGAIHDQSRCFAAGCRWDGVDCFQSRTPMLSAYGCVQHTSCDTCQGSSCLWCPSQRLCVNNTVYGVTFPYGQCLEWVSLSSDCPTSCNDYKSCDNCHSNVLCGWCDDGSSTGKGTCFYGSLYQLRPPPPLSQFLLPGYNFVPVYVPTVTPLPVNATMVMQNATETPTVDVNATELPYTCTDDLWHFTSCPACQCNGHSTCVNESICFNCSGNTEGEKCERCTKHFYGDARNGGECKPCFCNGHGDECHDRTGECHCQSRGLGGKECERCDSGRYIGSGANGSFCYYKLVPGYHYTFNLTTSYLSSAYFASLPQKDNDFYFFYNNESAYTTNVTIILSFAENGVSSDATFIRNWTNPVNIKYIMDSDNYNLERSTMTVFVDIVGFKPPFPFTVGFALPPEDLNLPEFFVTFFGCFTAMLLIAALVWKIKQKWESYRTNRARVQEMEMMAARPFSAVRLILDSCVTGEEIKRQGQAGRRMKIVPVATEMCANRRAALATVVVRLPGYESGRLDVGQCAVCFGSCLAPVGSQQNQDRTNGVKPQGKTKRTANSS